MKARLALLLAVLAWPALAQTRQPAQITTLPTTSPQEFDLLDKNGNWMPLNTGAGVDVRMAGCVADGVTDQTTCINNALTKAPDCVIIPATQNGFYSAGTINVAKCMRGTVWNPNAAAVGPAGTSFIKCNNAVAVPCVTVNSTGNAAAQIENVSIIGGSATPSAGSIGFQWLGGYNLILTNVQIANFDTCASFGPAASAISMHSTNAMISRCQKHYVVNDGIPELYFTGGRWGENGGADYNSADDFVYSTKTTIGGAGAGPNSLVIDTLQMNPGGKSVGCAFRWGGFTGTGGGISANKIVNTHVEINDAGYTGSAPQGMICVDATVPTFPGLRVTSSTLQTDGGAANHPTFVVNPTIPWGDAVFFSDNNFGAAAFTLTVSHVVGGHGPTFVNNYIPGNSSFVAGDATAGLMLTNNTLGTYTISGQWGSLLLAGNNAVPIDNATGGVYEASGATRSWTPTLSSTGASFTYTAQAGTWWRTGSRGLMAYFSIALSNVSGAAGNIVSITGMPKICNGLPGSMVLQSYSGFTGLTGAVLSSWINGSSTINLLQAGAGGSANVVGTNLTSTANMVGTVSCGQAQ